MGCLQHPYIQLLNILVAALLECKAETQTPCKVYSSSISSVQGDTMSISCLTTTQQPESLVVKLRRTNTDKQILQYPDPDNPPASQDRRWSMRTDSGNVTLDLKNVTLSDTGHYECSVYSKDKDCLTTNFYLRVKECKVLDPVCAKPLSNAKLSCSKNFDMSVTVKWEVVQGDQSTEISKYSPKHSNTGKALDAFNMRATERNRSLYIRPVLNTDESWYRCRVTQTSCYEVKLQVKDCEAFHSTTVLETLSITPLATDAPALSQTAAVNVATTAVASVFVCVIISLIVCVILYLKKRTKTTSQMQFHRNSLYFQISEGLEPLYHIVENNPVTMTTFGAEQTEATACRSVHQPVTKCSY